MKNVFMVLWQQAALPGCEQRFKNLLNRAFGTWTVLPVSTVGVRPMALTRNASSQVTTFGHESDSAATALDAVAFPRVSLLLTCMHGALNIRSIAIF